jgi:hypothetical protein
MFSAHTRCLLHFINREKYTLPPNVSPLFQSCLQSEKIAMHLNQVLKIFNVAHPLLKSIFDGNRPTCDTRWLLREILSEISFKNHFFFLKREYKTNKKEAIFF